MFGITPFGWLHTLGSLPAIPAAAYMLVRHGRITPRSIAGRIYFVCIVIGGLTVFLVAAAPESPIIGAATLLLLFAGYAVGRVTILGRVRWYMETFFLTLTVFLLMVPAVSETLRRVPDGHPIVTDPGSPILRGAIASLVAFLVLGLAAQFVYLFKFKVSKRAQ